MIASVNFFTTLNAGKIPGLSPFRMVYTGIATSIPKIPAWLPPLYDNKEYFKVVGFHTS
jgi:hypothetical protein